MSVEIITKEDLAMFRVQLLDDLKQMLSTKETPKRWLRSKEVRKLLNISAGTLQQMRINGTLHGKQLPGSRIWYYSEDEINALLDNA